MTGSTSGQGKGKHRRKKGRQKKTHTHTHTHTSTNEGTAAVRNVKCQKQRVKGDDFICFSFRFGLLFAFNLALRQLCPAVQGTKNPSHGE